VHTISEILRYLTSSACVSTEQHTTTTTTITTTITASTVQLWKYNYNHNNNYYSSLLPLFIPI